MNYEISKTFTCKTYNDTLIIKQYTKTRCMNRNNEYPINGAWVLFNGKEEHWNDGKIFNFIENWC